MGATLALTLVLSGCTAKEKAPTVLPPVPSSSPSRPPPSPPPEAAAETAEGATAFARYYFEVVVNRGYETLDPTDVARSSAPSCNSCKNIVSDIERLRSGGLRVSGRRFVIEYAETAPLQANGAAIVDFRFAADSYQEVDSNGVVVRQEDAQSKQDAQVKLVRSGVGWLVSGIRMVTP